jgi:hypothetical protein
MKAIIASLALFATAVLPAWAQPQPGQPIRLTIRPAPEPVPALKYRLVPALEESEPGNRALLYYRSLSPELWSSIRQTEVMEKVNKALHTPLKELKGPIGAEVGWVVNLGVLRLADRAADREYVDWGITTQIRKDGIGMLLPDVQTFREIGTLLALRARLEMADGHHDRALNSLRTGMMLGRDVSEAPTIIQGLVGAAIVSIMLEQLEDLIQTPGAPNLYWALSDLRRPFLDIRNGLEGEKIMVLATLPALKDAVEGRVLTPEQQRALVKFVHGLASSGPGEERSLLSADVTSLLRVTKLYPLAKRALISQGRKPAEVEALPIAQVVLLHSWQQYLRLRDDLFKWYGLPYWQARPGLERAEKEIKRAREEMTEGLPLASSLLPALGKIAIAQARTERRIAALRCIEAIRLYAATHDGKLPPSLDDITDVPIPTDPMTGKPFEYKADGNRATLHGTLPPAVPDPYILKYELTLQR